VRVLGAKVRDIGVHTNRAQVTEANLRKKVEPCTRTLKVLRITLEELNVTHH
jgi:hypothetical protein